MTSGNRPGDFAYRPGVAAELGIDLAEIAPVWVPRRGVQLAMSGAVIMADWIASSEKQFPGIADIAQVSIAGARSRAADGWANLRLRGGWSVDSLGVFPDQVEARFGRPARSAQADAVSIASRMAAPGLLLLEAPMGEGKTEAALAAAEVLAARFGADGVFVGMPTQATSDPMFSRVRAWAQGIEPGIPVGLLHGKRRFNPEWKDLQQQVTFAGVDDFGCCDDDYRATPAHWEALQLVPADWFLGPKRGLLSALTVGTVDHLLYAATRTRHVMLRHAGLAGRVVILDEIHAYDVYMSQFLFEALRWLADAGVPVVLLSATLPPALRRAVVNAYLQGALAQRDLDLSALPAPAGYPDALSVCVVDGQPQFEARASASWRPSMPVQVELLEEGPDDGPEQVVDVLREAMRDGGCALVVRNTVRRAQETYAQVAELFGVDAVLLHARMTAGVRADRTDRVLRMLSAPDRPDVLSRPRRLVVVATQLAEQSFDADVDLLITDLAPIDLLLQRVGRLHRHSRPEGGRPDPVRVPKVVITGVAPAIDGPPTFPGGSVAVYGDYLLLRSASLVAEAIADGWWNIPSDVPGLVARGYADDVELLPETWRDRTATAHAEWLEQEQRRAATASGYLLSRLEDVGKTALDGLHDRSVSGADDDQIGAAVRDGDESVEVVLVRRGDGTYLSLGGRRLGPDGEVAVSDAAVLDEVARSSIRLPSYRAVTAAAHEKLRPLAGWGLDPWLRSVPAFVLDDALTAELGGYRFTYSDEFGLVDERLTGRVW